jgi:hypothetical protein
MGHLYIIIEDSLVHVNNKKQKGVPFVLFFWVYGIAIDVVDSKMIEYDV